MSYMVRELYDALRQAGVGEDKAQRAAEAVADGTKPIADLRVAFAELTGKVTLLQWMVGFNIGLGLAVLAVLLRILENGS